MAYTTIDDSSAFFQTKIYTGTGSSNALTFDGNSNLQPDFVWGKQRNGTNQHHIHDSVRGATKRMRADSTDAEDTQAQGLKSFDSDGFTMGTASFVNANDDTYVGWGWKCEAAFSNDASSTSIGSIDSSGKANDTAGFSIVTYTGTGSNGTIKHGLSTAPKMIITHQIGGGEWYTYHTGIASDAETDYLNLHVTVAASDDAEMWNDTAPTTSVFSVGVNGNTNGSSDATIAYCFSDIKGYSKMGQYTGNGATDGVFIFTGFKAAFIMIKRTNAASNWNMYDNKRLGYNAANQNLVANTTGTDDAGNPIDILSNGFKLRNSDVSANADGSNYIFMAFAEHPMTTSSGVPTTAR